MTILEAIKIEGYYTCSQHTSVYLADISGVDSIAALVSFLGENHDSIVVPSFVELACEYGDKLYEFNKVLSSLYAKFNAIDNKRRILPGIILDVNTLWKELVSTDIPSVVNQFKFYSPCIACHFAFHLARIRFAQTIGAKGVISGERELHGTKEKINQLDFVLDFFNNVYADARIKHFQPVRKISQTADINSILSGFDIEPVKVKCLFSGNYRNRHSHEIDISKENIKQYLEHLTNIYSKTSSSINVTIKELVKSKNAGHSPYSHHLCCRFNTDNSDHTSSRLCSLNQASTSRSRALASAMHCSMETSSTQPPE